MRVETGRETDLERERCVEERNLIPAPFRIKVLLTYKGCANRLVVC